MRALKPYLQFFIIGAEPGSGIFRVSGVHIRAIIIIGFGILLCGGNGSDVTLLGFHSKQVEDYAGYVGHKYERNKYDKPRYNAETAFTQVLKNEQENNHNQEFKKSGDMIASE
jgi:hypothetical protein